MELHCWRKIFFVSFSFASTVLSLSAWESEYNYNVQIPLEPNGTVFMDLRGQPNIKRVINMLSIGDPNRYALFTRFNPDVPQYISFDKNTILNSHFNPDVNTVVLIHGWDSDIFNYFVPTLKNVLLRKYDVNVIAIDWDKVSSLYYVTAVFAVPYVGSYIGVFLKYLTKVTHATYSSMHLIGHSLGAHVAGNAGRYIRGKAARITGCDPAGPLWYYNPYRLAPTDAVYVEVIHTNVDVYGIGINVGTVDFYANGGTLQPGCDTITCNHARSYKLLAASIQFHNGFIGKECGSLYQVTLDECKGTKKLPFGGVSLDKNGSGTYRFDTGSKYPYL